jgi:hypothetical protein
MATRTHSRTATGQATGQVTVAEGVLGPVAGALVGYATFAVLVTILAAVGLHRNLPDPQQHWKDLGFGASITAGVLLFVGYLYGSFIAGRAAGAGRAGLMVGLSVFVAGLALALIAAWAVRVGTSGDEARQLERALRILGTPGSVDDWRQIGSTAGAASLTGMLFGSVAGGALAQRRPAA